jgi:hypothetical protein
MVFAHVKKRRRKEWFDPSCLKASFAKFFLRKPVTFLRESAAGSPKWIKRRLPRTYYYLSLRPLLRWLTHLRADAVLVSFPKCGRTWLRMMIGRALSEHYELGDTDLLSLRKLCRLHPDIPRILVEHEDDPFWKTADQLHHTKTEYRHKKIVFLVREPKDVVVSSYFHKSKREGAYTGSLSDYIREPEGGIDTILEYYNIWEKNSEVPCGFLGVSYEEMHRDSAGVLRRVLDFLGCDAVSDEAVREAAGFSSFDRMREMEEKGQHGIRGKATADLREKEAFKVRKGRVGGHAEYLSAEDIALLDARIRARLSTSYGYARGEHGGLCG